MKLYSLLDKIISNFLVATFKGIKTQGEVLARSNLVFAVHVLADSFNLLKLDAFFPSKSEAHKMSIW